MAVTNGVYQSYVRRIMTQSSAIDLNNDPIRVCLIKDAHTPDFDGDVVLNDLGTSGGDRAKTAGTWSKPLTSPSIISSNGGNAILFATNIQTLTFQTVTSGVTVGGVIVYKSSNVGTRTDSPVICLASFSSAVTADGGEVTVTLNTNGILKGSYQT